MRFVNERERIIEENSQEINTSKNDSVGNEFQLDVNLFHGTWITQIKQLQSSILITPLNSEIFKYFSVK